MAVLSKALALGVLALPLAAQAAQLVVSHFSGTVYSLELSDEGSLSITDDISGVQRIPAWVTWDSASRLAYVSDESWFGANSGTFAAYSLAEDGTLAVSGSAKTNGGDLASGLYGGSNGAGFIAQANYNGGSLSTWKLPLTSGAQQLQSFKYTMSSPGPVPSRQDAPHLHSAFVDPTGNFLLSGDLGADLIRVWKIDTSSGKLTECSAIKAGAGDGPRHGSFTTINDATYLYVVNELGNSVRAYSITYPQGGCLTGSSIQSLSTYPTNQTKPTGVKASEVIVKDSFVYASNRNDKSFGSEQDSIAVYAIAPSTGQLELLDFTNSYGFFPRTFSINEAGTLVAVGGQTDAVVSVLKRDPETGLLGPLVDSINVGRRGTVNGEDGLSAVTWAE